MSETHGFVSIFFNIFYAGSHFSIWYVFMKIIFNFFSNKISRISIYIYIMKRTFVILINMERGLFSNTAQFETIYI